MFDIVLKYNVLMGILFGFVFAVVGMVVRTGPGAAADRDNLVLADGFQGLTIATLVVIATMVYYIDDARAVVVLREQASVISTFSILGSLQQLDRFRRSLKS